MNKIADIIPFWILFIGICLGSCTPKEERRILVIHSYEDTYAGYSQFNKLIAEEFRKQGIHADLSILYLNCEAYLAQEELDRMNAMLDSVAGWKPEIILVNEDQATYSLLKCGNALVKQIPIVFAGVNYPNRKLIGQYPNVTGFHDKMDFMANIDMGRRLFGEKTDFFSIMDTTYLDMKVKRDIQEQIKGKNVSFIHRNSRKKQYKSLKDKGYTTYAEVPVRLADERGSGPLMWALSQYFKNRCYIQVKRDFTTVNISNITPSPCLTAINEAFDMNEKFLGGYFTTQPIQIAEEVGAACQILRGKSPGDIPIRESAKRYMIDWKVMKQLKIPLDKIPTEYTIINIPFREKHHILWLTGIIAVSGLLIAVILRLTFLYRREQKRKRKALYALADEKETLALAIEGGTTYVWKLEENCFVFENAFWKSLDMKPHTLTIDDLIKYIHPAQQALFLQNWEKLSTAQKEIVQIQCDFNRKGYQWWEFRYTTTRLATGALRTAGLLLNIQTFKEREQELEEARELAEKAELKESFLANMSHEIRTPLNAIVGFSTLLASDEELEPEDKQDYIASIHDNNRLLLKLISDILELSRIKSGYMSFTYEQCRVDSIINNIYNSYQMTMPPHIKFLKEEDGDVTLEINVDRERLVQVITNFLNNACKFTQQGYIKLGYKYIPAEEEVQIFVEDSGQGIEPKEQKMIFTRFYKHNEFSQGTGLGLSICQSIVEKLNGKIDVWSEPGKGSRFTVILPCKAVF